MIEELLEQEYQLERTRIIGETAQIPWLELQRFFAAGKVIWIATELDLVDVAWVGDDELLWSVVVKPWVLVQELSPGA
jgi:hypothetical protein